MKLRELLGTMCCDESVEIAEDDVINRFSIRVDKALHYFKDDILDSPVFAVRVDQATRQLIVLVNEGVAR